MFVSKSSGFPPCLSEFSYSISFQCDSTDEWPTVASMTVTKLMKTLQFVVLSYQHAIQIQLPSMLIGIPGHQSYSSLSH